MKKTLFFAVIALSLVACAPQEISWETAQKFKQDCLDKGGKFVANSNSNSMTINNMRCTF